jgi:mannonate dehydratase
MDISIRCNADSGVRLQLAKQMGVEHAVADFTDPGDGTEPWSYENLRTVKEGLAEHGIEFAATESRPPMEKTVLGEEGREEEIETVKTCIRNLGRLGVDTYCWVWTENPLGVLRTHHDAPDRGGSTQTRYHHETAEAEGEHPAADITEDELWENLEYFLGEVVPVAEEAGVKMALHPDDPPTSPIRGVPRIITSVDAYDRVLDIYDSEHNGVAFCQGNFAAMGADIPETIRHFGERIHLAHFRDVEGAPDDFRETWHDDGPTDMGAAIEAYLDADFDGTIRPDHVGGMAGDTLGGGGNKGRLFAVGYLKGLIDQAERRRA